MKTLSYIEHAAVFTKMFLCHRSYVYIKIFSRCSNLSYAKEAKCYLTSVMKFIRSFVTEINIERDAERGQDPLLSQAKTLFNWSISDYG